MQVVLGTGQEPQQLSPAKRPQEHSHRPCSCLQAPETCRPWQGWALLCRAMMVGPGPGCATGPEARRAGGHPLLTHRRDPIRSPASPGGGWPSLNPANFTPAPENLPKICPQAPQCQSAAWPAARARAGLLWALLVPVAEELGCPGGTRLVTYYHVFQGVLGKPAVQKNRDEQIPQRRPEYLEKQGFLTG